MYVTNPFKTHAMFTSLLFQLYINRDGPVQTVTTATVIGLDRGGRSNEIWCWAHFSGHKVNLRALIWGGLCTG